MVHNKVYSVGMPSLSWEITGGKAQQNTLQFGRIKKQFIPWHEMACFTHKKPEIDLINVEFKTQNYIHH